MSQDPPKLLQFEVIQAGPGMWYWRLVTWRGKQLCESDVFKTGRAADKAGRKVLTDIQTIGWE